VPPRFTTRCSRGSVRCWSDGPTSEGWRSGVRACSTVCMGALSRWARAPARLSSTIRRPVEVVAVEPEPSLRRLASAAAELAPVPVRVIDGVAEELPAEGTTFDAAVSCNILCSVRDPVLATAELHRVLRPGGILRFNEHVVSEHPAVSRVQRAADATLWPLLSGGCHLGRDTLAELRRAGFVTEYCARTSGVRAVGPPKSYVFGSARRAYEPTAAPASP